MATKPVAQPGRDATRADSRHYTIETETEKVRVLRAKYGPGEKSEMHGHPSLLAIMLTDFNIRFTYPDGRTEETSGKAGQVMNMPPTEHCPENLSNRPFEAVLVEFKG